MWLELLEHQASFSLYWEFFGGKAIFQENGAKEKVRALHIEIGIRLKLPKSMSLVYWIPNWSSVSSFRYENKSIHI